MSNSLQTRRSSPQNSIGSLKKRSRNSQRWNWAKGLIVPSVLSIGWEILSQVKFFPPNLLPAPSAVLETIGELTVSGELFQHIGITLYRVALGFLIGSGVATILGAMTGYSRSAHQFLDPLLQSLRNIPSLAWVPLFILWMGIQETSKIALIAVGVFFPVYLNLMSGVRDVDRKLVEVGKVYRLNSFQLIRRVFLPATLPSYVVGLRSGLGLGWMFVVAAEIMGASKGLGFLLVDGQTTGRPTIILASILLFAAFGKLTDAAIATIGKRLLSWQDSHISHF